MIGSLSRRGFMTGSLIGVSSVLAGTSLRPEQAVSSTNDTRPFFDQYFDGIMKILKGLRDSQLTLIERETMTACKHKQKGGTIYSQITTGHFPIPETALDRIGQPGVLAFLPRNAEAEYASITPNDMIFTSTINFGNIDAMKRGIRVIAVTNNYYPFYQTPPEEGYQIEYEGKLLKIEDTAHVTIDSQMPWHNGLVHAQDHPAFAIIPSSGLAQATVYWMIAAELAGLIAANGKKGDSRWALDYVSTCIERAKMVGQDRPKFNAVAKKLGDLVQQGARWYVYGANHALVSDAVGVATGPMVTRRYNADEVKAGDIVLIGAYSSNHPDEIAVARESRRKGAYAVAITPYSTDGDTSGTRLFKEVDAAFNNYSPESWGVVPIKGLERKVCPTTGVISDLVMWLLVAQWTQFMADRGSFPYYWKGFFMKNGRGFNNRILPYFRARGW